MIYWLINEQAYWSRGVGGKTAGGIRVCLDLFCYFFVSRQKSKERKKKEHFFK